MRLLSIGVLCISVLMLATTGAMRVSNADLRVQVADTERAFAATMRARDFDAFGAFLADEAVFLSGDTVLRGHDAVAREWRRFYDGEHAPFTWAPDRVEVVASGTLAYSSGPVYGGDGRQVGRFDSIWRLEAPGRWRIVFERSECLAGVAASCADACPRR
ncbi:YybH family protein [Massilia forsythiae]|nr:nuclear transport factor 2 family protein [Massilia forsythiae]